MRPFPFTTAGYGVIFWGAFAIWLAPELARGLTRRPAAGSTTRDRGSLGVVLGLVAVGVLVAFWLAARAPGAAIRWGQPVVFGVGIALMLLGVALRSAAIRTLGHNFAPTVSVRPGQPVVEAGPYRYIRHPSYSGALLTLLGLGLALGGWASVLAVLLCGGAGVAYRVSVEERMLRRSLGRPYEEYMRRTRRLIPFVL